MTEIEIQEALGSITVITSHEHVNKGIKEELAKKPNSLKVLSGATIIMVENTLNGAKLQQFTGVTIAMRLIVQDPNKKILLYSASPLWLIRQRQKDVDILLAKPNVRHIEVPCSVEDMAELFEQKSKKADTEQAANAMADRARRELGGIWHDIKKAKNPFAPQGDYEKQMVASGIARAKESFPMLATKDDESVLRFLEEVSGVREEVMKGNRLTGLFCDMEGTLFSNGVLNANVLATLNDNEAKGKEITLWTDGNLPELQALLDANNINYPLRAKRDFAGAIVEIAIDDMDEHSFSALTKVYAERFIRVDDL